MIMLFKDCYKIKKDTLGFKKTRKTILQAISGHPVLKVEVAVLCLVKVHKALWLLFHELAVQWLGTQDSILNRPPGLMV